MYIGRPSRLPLYVKGVAARRQQILNEYLLSELTFDAEDLIVDIGANVGDLTAAIQERTPVHAVCIEPEELEFLALRRNVLPKKTHVYNELLYSEQCAVRFYSANDQGDSSLIEPSQHASSCMRLTTTLDALMAEDRFFQSRRRVRLLKLEAEGAEPEVLAGARDVIPHCDFITADLGPERGAQQETTLVAVTRLLMDYGFRPLRFGLPRCVMLFQRM
jgi:FkbM family methyltransferase